MVKYSLFTSISYPPVPQQYYSVSDRYLIGIWSVSGRDYTESKTNLLPRMIVYPSAQDVLVRQIGLLEQNGRFYMDIAVH